MTKSIALGSFPNSRKTPRIAFLSKDFGRIKLIIQEGEGLTLEFKERFTPRIVEDRVAFTNARGGSIILDIRDNGITVGEKLDNDLKARILSLARNCSPSIEISTRQVGELIEVIVP